MRRTNPLYKGRDVIQGVRYAYCNTTERVESICARFGVYVTTVRSWRRKYGWPRRTGMESRTWRPALLSRPGELAPHPRDLDIKAWRCDCGRVNLEPRCPCGYVPQWAA